MASYEHTVYVNELEAEILLGLVAEDDAECERHGLESGLKQVAAQLYRILGTQEALPYTRVRDLGARYEEDE